MDWTELLESVEINLPIFYLKHVFTFIPLGDEKQLGQAFGIMVSDLCTELPQELLLVLKELCVVFVVHDFF